MAKSFNWRRSKGGSVAEQAKKTVVAQKNVNGTNGAAATKVEIINRSNHSKNDQVEESRNEDETVEESPVKKETTMIETLCAQLGFADAHNDTEADELSTASSTHDDPSTCGTRTLAELYRPKALQHEKMVIEDLSGGLAFLTFSRVAMVEETTQILIKVMATTFSPDDAKKCCGIGLTQSMLPYVPGNFVIGTIEDIGADVDSVFEIGDRVIGMVDGGGCSRFLSAEQENFLKAPSCLSNSTALALMQDWMPAYRALHVAKNSIQRANLFGMNVLVTDAMSSPGQAVIALATEECANLYCCAKKTHHNYLKSLNSKIVCLEPETESWLPEVRDKMDVVVDNTCVDGYVSSCEAVGNNGVLISLPYVSFEDTRLFGLFDFESFERKLNSTKANLLVCHTIHVDTREEFKLEDDEDETSAEKRVNFVRDYQYLASLYSRGLIKPKISDKLSLQAVSSAHNLLKSGTVGTGGTLVCFPWKQEGEKIRQNE